MYFMGLFISLPVFIRAMWLPALLHELSLPVANGVEAAGSYWDIRGILFIGWLKGGNMCAYV